MTESQRIFVSLKKYIEYITHNCDIYFGKNNWTLSTSFSIHNWLFLSPKASKFSFHIQHKAKDKVFEFDFSIEVEQFLNPPKNIGYTVVHLLSLTCEVEDFPEEVELCNFDINFTLEDALEVTAIKIREKYYE